MPTFTPRLSALAIAALSGALIVGVASPAVAATTSSSLQTELLAGGPATVTLENDVTVTSSTLYVDGFVTLDLHGFDLVAKSIMITDSSSLTVTDLGTGGTLVASGVGVGQPGIVIPYGSTLTLSGGTITVTGDAMKAGISGGDVGTILINGATVTATGGTGGAGIGGNQGAPGAKVTVASGTVNAYGGSNAAGIGGGSAGSGHDISVTGGTVNAWGGQGFASGAGIGGGYNGAAYNLSFTGGTTSAYGASNAAGIGTGEATVGTASGITIGAGAVVNATSGTGGSGSSGYPYPSAVGGAENTISSGAITIAGTLNVFGHFRHNGYGGGAITIDSTGVLGGTADIRGQNGAIVNNGTITNPNVVNAADTGGGVTVTVHSYLVSFIAPDATPSGYSERVYGTSFAAVGKSLWAGAVRTGWVFDRWIDQGGGAAFTTASTVTANRTVEATWIAGTVVDDLDYLEVTPASSTIAAGQSVSFSAEGFDASDDSLGDFSSSAVFSSGDSSAVVNGSSIAFTTAGTHTVSATVGSISATASVTVTAGAVDDVSLELSTVTVLQGNSLTFEVWTVDEFGNRVANVSSSAVVTSDQPTDVISGTTVTFPHASPHVITATLGGFSASVTVQVTAVVAQVTPLAALGATGTNSLPLLIIGAALLLAGAGVILWRRRAAKR